MWTAPLWTQEYKFVPYWLPALCRLVADGPGWSAWKVDVALVYMVPINGLLKRAIEKGERRRACVH